jgi:hypothetical protein
VRTHLELRNMQLNLAELVAERTAELARSEAKYRDLVRVKHQVMEMLEKDEADQIIGRDHYFY